MLCLFSVLVFVSQIKILLCRNKKATCVSVVFFVLKVQEINKLHFLLLCIGVKSNLNFFIFFSCRVNQTTVNRKYSISNSRNKVKAQLI